MWAEPAWRKAERERQLRMQHPEFEFASPDRVLQVDNYRVNNGGFVSKFSQMAMRLAKYAAEENDLRKLDQPVDERPGQMKRPGVPRGVAEAFPETVQGGPVYDSGSSNAFGIVPRVAGGLNTPLTTGRGMALEEASRPTNWMGAAVRGLSFAPRAPLLARAGIEIGSALAGRYTGEKVTEATGNELLGGIAGLGTNIAAGGLASRPGVLSATERGLTGYRDLTKGIPVGASIKQFDDDALRALTAQVDSEGGWTAETIAKYQEITGRRPTASMRRPAESIGPPNTTPEGIRQGAGNALVKGAGKAGINISNEVPLLKVFDALDQAKAAVPQNQANVAALHARQTAIYENAYKSAIDKGMGSSDAARYAQGALRGVTARVAPSFTPLGEVLDQATVDAMYRSVNEADVPTGTKLTLNGLMQKLINGGRVTPSEIVTFERVFGPDNANVLATKLQKVGGLEGVGLRENIEDVLNIPRTIMSTGDLSGSLRQGAFLSAGHPIQAAKTFPDYIRAAATESGAQAVEDRLMSLPHTQELIDSGLYFPRWGAAARLDTREEAFASRLLTKIPGIRQAERGYVQYLKALRADVGNNIVEGWDEAQRTPQNMDRLATFLNAATGRGTLGPLENIASELNIAFFSPRYFASRVQLGAKAAQAFANLSKETVTTQGFREGFDPVSKEIARDTIAFVGTGVTVLAMLKASGAADVELDPRSSDFGKVRIGDTRYDFWAGFQQIARLAAQLATNQGKATSSGNIYGLNRAVTVGKFFQSKLSPSAGLGVDLLRGETPLGEPLDRTWDAARTQAWNRLTPLFIQDIVDAIQEYGIGEGALRGVPGFFGVGTQTYEARGAGVTNALTAAGNRLYPDDQKDFYDRPIDQRNAILEANPDLAAKRSQERMAQEGPKGALETMRVQFRADQEVDNTRVQNHEIDWEQWKDNRTRRSDELRGASQITYGPDGMIEKPKDAYEEWLNVIKEHEGPDGVDWDAVDVWVQQQDAARQKNIADGSGMYGTQLEKDRRAVADRLDAAGYFDYRDKVWQKVAPKFGMEQYKTADDFQREAVQQLSTRLAQRGITGAQADILIGKILEDLAPLKVWRDVSNDVEEAWIKQNVTLAADAIEYGYIRPSGLRKKEEAAIMGAGR